MLVGAFSCKTNDKRKARERALATFDENRREVGMLHEPYARQKKQRHVPGGRRDDTCDHGLSRRSPRVKASYELSWKVKVMIKTHIFIHSASLLCLRPLGLYRPD